MTKTDTFWYKYKFAIAVSASSLVLGIGIGVGIDIIKLPLKFMEFDRRLKEVEQKQDVQDKKIEILTEIIRDNKTQFIQVQENQKNLSENFNRFFNRFERFEDSYYKRIPLN